jgi:hypothetical protein
MDLEGQGAPRAPVIYIEPWSSGYGSPMQIDEENEATGEARFIEEEGFDFVPPRVMAIQPMAFVDGVRRQEAALSQWNEGRSLPGIAGAYAVGAVTSDGRSPPIFTNETVQRLVIWAGGLDGSLPDIPSGWTWRVESTPDPTPGAPLRRLQELMRRAEARLGHLLAASGHLVLLDGTLWFAESYEDKNIAGYVKTHHVRLLPEAEARRLPDLPAGWRTTIFRTPANRYACYLRLAQRTIYAPPLAGIVRLEFSGTVPLAQAREMATRFAVALPPNAGVPYVDPRAPQNLQPIGALETHLRHLLGDLAMAERAARDSVALTQRKKEATHG